MHWGDPTGRGLLAFWLVVAFAAFFLVFVLLLPPSR